MALGGELQGYEVLVVVALVVAAQTDEDGQLVVLQLRVVGHQVVGVHIHLQTLVLAQVEVGVLVDGLRLVLRQVLHHQAERLLVVLRQLRLRGVGSTADARRQHVGHRLALSVLLNVDGAGLQQTRLGAGTGLQVLLVLAPLAADQVETAEAKHHRLLEASEEHTHETNRGKVVDSAYLLFPFAQRHTVLIPAHGERVAVAQLSIVVAVVYDIRFVRLLPAVVGLQLVVADGYAILVVALILVQCEVLIDVLHVWSGFVRCVVRLRLVVAGRRVALRVVDALVAVHDALALTVEVGAAEVVVVIAGRVAAPGAQHAVVGDDAANLVEPLLVGSVLALLAIGQSVQAYVLQRARATGGGKGIGLRGLHRNLTPLGGLVRGRAVDWHTALVEFLTVAQHVFRHLAEVDVQLAGMTRGRSLLTGVDVGVEQPELHIFYISLLKVGGLQTAHHAAPLLGWLHQRAVGIELRGEVVGAAFLRIVSQVQHRQRRDGTIEGRLVAVRIELFHVDLADVVVAELVEVALDVRGGKTAAAPRKNGVDIVPRQQSALVAAADRGLVVMVGKHRGHAAEHPRLRVADVEHVLRVLEVVDVRRIVLRAVSLAGNELCKLSGERDLRRLRTMQQRQAVEHVGEPLRLLLPVHVQTPDGVVERLLAHIYFRGERLFLQMHQRTAQREVLVEVVLPVHAHHRLAVQTVVVVRLQGNVHVRASIDNALVEDGHLAGRVVYGIVGAFSQGDAAGGNHHRPLRHVVGTQRDDVGRGALELSAQQELVLFCILLGDGLGRIVQLVETILVCQLAQALALQIGTQIIAEGLGRRQEDASVADRVALHEVELSVGMRLHVGIEAVQSHHLQQCCRLQLLLGQVVQVGTRGIALVFDV